MIRITVDYPEVQTDLFGRRSYTRPNGSLLKWIGNKYRMAEQITSYFPIDVRTYYEVFLGGGAVLATIAPARGVGSDSFAPLIEIWRNVKSCPDIVKQWYEERWRYAISGNKRKRYEEIRSSYNSHPNAGDFLYLTRSCYGGVVRFRKKDGYMSTPVGIHTPIPPQSFAKRVDEWHRRVQGTTFRRADYSEIMKLAETGDMIYCDPPYTFSQAILYGAQDFKLAGLLKSIESCKERGVRVALSIDGTKKSGSSICNIHMPKGLFENEVFINSGRSMLRRFQMDGQSLESEIVADRLLLTY